MIWIFVALAVIVAAAAVWYFFFSEPDMDTPAEPVPQGSPTPAWQAESFPLNVGMFGNKIKALQTALGITADGKFGNQTKAAVTAKGYAVPLSEADYNKIVEAKDPSNPIGKAAYAKFDGVKVYVVANNTVYKTAKKDEWLGTISGEWSGDSSYLTVTGGLYRVYKPSVYWK